MTTHRTGAILLGYNQEEYIEYALRALLPYVEHAVVLLPEKPFVAYNPRAREEFVRRDETAAILARVRREHPHLEVAEGLWDSEVEMRNEGLHHLRRLGVEVCLSIDADEVWPEGALRRLREEIARVDEPETVYFARYETCYRSFEYVVDSDHRLPVAAHLAPDTRFSIRRLSTGVRRDLPDDLFFWHMGYVLSDARMWEKIRTFSHAHEVLPGWWEEKWLGFTSETRDLFRRAPASRWAKTRRMDPRDLPEILHGHPFFPTHRRRG